MTVLSEDYERLRSSESQCSNFYAHEQLNSLNGKRQIFEANKVADCAHNI